jgi:hypothetical protein
LNLKTLATVIIVCGIFVLSTYPLSVSADISDPFVAVSTPMLFTPATQFSIPTTNGTIDFAQIGYYENAILVNDTWVFSHLQLDSSQTDLLSDSPTTANLNITTRGSNVTITSFDRLLTPDPNDCSNNGSWLTVGWLNYTSTGAGKQIVKIQFNLTNSTKPSQYSINGTATWPISVGVYINGKEADYNQSWSTIKEMIPFGVGVVINKASSNVSVKYEWAPVPISTSQSASDSSLRITNISPNSPASYILIIVAVSGIIIPLAIFTNRHRLESIINKRIKRKQKPY